MKFLYIGRLGTTPTILETRKNKASNNNEAATEPRQPPENFPNWEWGRRGVIIIERSCNFTQCNALQTRAIFDRMKGDGERTYALVVREKAVAMFLIASFVKHNLWRTKTKVHVSKIITIVKLSLF